MFQIIFFIFLFFCNPVIADIISGRPTVLNGSTIIVNGIKVNLYGIRAPKMDQICIDKRNKTFNCGHSAMHRLFLYIGADPLECLIQKRINTDQATAICLVKSYFNKTISGVRRGEKFDVGLEMILTGHATAVSPSLDEYITAEKYAKHHKNGFWSAKVPPRHWKANK